MLLAKDTGGKPHNWCTFFTDNT